MKGVSQREHRRAIAALHRLADKAMRRAMQRALAPTIERLRSRHLALTADASDELAAFHATWVEVVGDELTPMLEEAFGLGGLGAARQLGARHLNALIAIEDATGRVNVAEFVSAARLRFVAAAQPAWMKLGSDVWAKARGELLAGIAQGESVDQLADRLASMADMAGTLADTVARSMAVASANAGSFTEVKALGGDGPQGKQWLCTEDDRTRESHLDAHGQVQLIDDPFEVGGELLDYPGDEAGSPEETANCRCTILYVETVDQTGPQDLEQITMQLPNEDDELAASAAALLLTPAELEGVTLTAAAEEHTGGMVALIPSDEDAARLAVDGWESVEQLHVTLGYLGDGPFDDELRQVLMGICGRVAADSRKIVGAAHGVGIFNAATDGPCTVYLLSDTDPIGPNGVPPLVDAHDRLWDELDDYGSEGFPDQHSPWVPHIAAGYGLEDLALPGLGSEVTFDRLRLALGDEVTDFPLAAGDTVPVTGGAPMTTIITVEGAKALGAQIGDALATAMQGTLPLATSSGGNAGGSFIVDTGDKVTLAEGDAPMPPPEPAPVEEEPVDAAPEDEAAEPEEFHILMVTEEQATLEKPARFFAAGCFEWREPPFPLMWLNTDTHSDGDPDPSVQVALITRVERQGNEIHGWGVWDDPINEDAAEARRRVENGMLRWNSIDIGDVGEADIELVFPPPGTVAPDGIEVTEPEQITFHHGRIVLSTLVFAPAQENAQIEPLIFSTDEPDLVMPMSAERIDGDESLVAAAYRVEIPDVPPDEWFERPPLELLRRGALTITDEGRVYGLLAPGAVPHVGLSERRTVPLRNVDYSDFLRGETPVRLADGKVGRRVSGNLTMACGHASPTLPNGATVAHYDNSCALFATANCGEHGGDVWVAGALLPGVDADQVRRAMACQLSGHWNPHELARGKYSLLGALLVPSPGFPKGRAEATATTRWGPNDDGDLMLVASAVPVVFEHTAPTMPALAPVAERIAKSIGLDRETRTAALTASAAQIAAGLGLDRKTRAARIAARVLPEDSGSPIASLKED